MPVCSLHSFIHSFIHLTTCPHRLSKRVRYKVQSCAYSFSFQYPLLPLRSSSSCLRLLPRPPVTSVLPSIFTSIPCIRRQFLRKMWPNQSALLLFIARTIILPSSTQRNSASFDTRSVQSIFSILPQLHIRKLSGYFLFYFPKRSNFSTKNILQMQRLTSVLSTILSTTGWSKGSSPCWMLLLPWQSRI